MHLLLLNAGSSSLKFSLMAMPGEEVLASGTADWASSPARYSFERDGAAATSETVSWRRHGDAVRRAVSDLKLDKQQLAAVVHRVVHGGTRFTQPTIISPEVKSALGALTELAPLHNPPGLDTIAAAEEALPGVRQIAVFDTAFHATLPPEACTYAVPYSWLTEWKVRRFGFHGLSHAYCAMRAAEMTGRSPEGLRLVIAHLGHGASVTAVKDGRSLDTSMGFTPLEGVMMGTRSGSVDPGLLLFVQRRHGLSPAELDHVLNHESGLLGVSGVSGDIRRVRDAREAGNPRADLALKMYAHRARQAIGAMAVTLGGIDALVFTGGVGEHAADMRQAIATGLECLGLHLDATANNNAQADADIAAGDSAGRILVIRTREDLILAREGARLVGERRNPT